MSAPSASSRAACSGSPRRCRSVWRASRRRCRRSWRRTLRSRSTCALTDRFVEVVVEGVDVAVRIAATLPDSSLVAVRVGDAERVVVAVPSYLRGRAQLRTPADLESHECLRYTRGRAPDEWGFRGPDGDVTVRVRGPLAADSLALRAAAIAGSGVLMTVPPGRSSQVEVTWPVPPGRSLPG